jgi:hypothetical protein
MCNTLARFSTCALRLGVIKDKMKRESLSRDDVNDGHWRILAKKELARTPESRCLQVLWV